MKLIRLQGDRADTHETSSWRPPARTPRQATPQAGRARWALAIATVIAGVDAARLAQLHSNTISGAFPTAQFALPVGFTIPPGGPAAARRLAGKFDFVGVLDRLLTAVFEPGGVSPPATTR